MQLCEVEACSRPLNKDGLCILHKLKSVNMNGFVRMRSEREANMTQRQMAREVYDNAKETNADIAQVRGRRTATQKYVNGVWV